MTPKTVNKPSTPKQVIIIEDGTEVKRLKDRLRVLRQEYNQFREAMLYRLNKIEHELFGVKKI